MLSPTAWLTDEIIHAAQLLLHSNIPLAGGLQNPIRGTTCSFDVECGEFLQILHNGVDHWLLVSTLGIVKEGVVLVYDSKYNYLTSHTQLQIASLLNTPHSVIRAKFIDVQQQSGNSDCGLFAIAYATALSLGEDPGKIDFDKSSLRKHLYSCLKSKKITMFPVIRRKRVVKVRDTVEIKIYCNCRLPEVGPMLECSKCLQWYHDSCVQPPQQALDNSGYLWYCVKCTMSCMSTE